MKDYCSFSNREISIPSVANSTALTIVECPTCGARRTVKSIGSGSYEYPRHTKLDGTTHERAHWQDEDGQWTFIEAQKSEPTNIEPSFTLSITVPEEFDGITLELALSQVDKGSHAYKVLSIVYKHYMEAIGEPQWAQKYPTQD